MKKNIHKVYNKRGYMSKNQGSRPVSQEELDKMFKTLLNTPPRKRKKNR